MHVAIAQGPAPPNGSPIYRLANHVSACNVAGDVILLDMRADQYIGVAESDGEVLADLVQDWPRTSKRMSSRISESTDAQLLAEQMVTDGLLIRASSDSRRPNTREIEKARVALLPGYQRKVPPIYLHHVMRAVRASLTARLLLRARSFEYVVRRFERRNCAHRDNEAGARNSSIESLRELASIFDRIRPWLYTAKDACLLDSLTLGEFLVGYNFYPAWVFGVSSEPFTAHCWLQHDDVVINDTPEHVLNFTRIMVA